jgi:hypothetical protein
MKKSLVSMLGAVALGVASMLPNEGRAAGSGNGYNSLSINNTSTDQTKQNRIEYNVGGTNGFSSPFYANNLKIYDANTTKSNTMIAVDTTTNNTFTATLTYVPNITKQGSENTLKFKFFNPTGTSGLESTFPSNILITAQISLAGQGIYTNIDVSKLIRDTASASFEGPIKLPNINTNGPNPYATLKVNFTRKESSIPEIKSLDLDLEKTNAAVTVNQVLPGEKIILESTTNLNDSASWVPLKTNYVGVTAQNFTEPDSVAFTNVPAIDKQRFFRARVQ